MRLAQQCVVSHDPQNNSEWGSSVESNREKRGSIDRIHVFQNITPERARSRCLYNTVVLVEGCV